MNIRFDPITSNYPRILEVIIKALGPRPAHSHTLYKISGAFAKETLDRPTCTYFLFL